MKRCSRCKEFKEEVEFSPKQTAKDKLHPYCKVCKALAQKQTRANNTDYEKERYKKNPEIKKSHVRVARAIKSGKIKRANHYTCVMDGCSNLAVHYHHLVYGPNALISPVCKTCHAQLHSRDSSERDLTLKIELNTSRKAA